ncbi:HK97-gp10 family putative phage morphogenesis protein [Mechercharimyces sp. CAU 1602]|uniref:HK97-gp10 family putative phage morphogenesis protein n=1 Tax=Mechercharimyces sp. CAU 1602 TaxID=2973933 RepID=UPI00216134E2|nr:HK97-gp10 family putative phage morphogenesis protein [Mechercharimyces sp. CAU 1602]MCS1351149.1 HK97 gp10 family phage protein [Mechercharimyces sp. CAU 1602]
MTFRGMQEMLDKLESIGQHAQRVENRALRAGGDVLKETMSRNAPGPSARHTKHLKDNIECSNVKVKKGMKLVEVGPAKEFFYGFFLETGTSKMPPHPFVGVSCDEAAGEVLDVMANEIRQGIGL